MGWVLAFALIVGVSMVLGLSTGYAMLAGFFMGLFIGGGLGALIAARLDQDHTG